MKAIKLTQGKYAIVDDEDFEFLSQWQWYTMKSGDRYYAARVVNDRHFFMHRAIIETDQFVDHIDGNGINNTRKNLRVVSKKQNSENRTRLGKNNKSGHTGVFFCNTYKRWVASLRHNGKNIHLGQFENIEEAIQARVEGEKKYFTHSPNCQDD